MTTKNTTKKFQLVSKYANYPTWDEKQNAPLKNKKEIIYDRRTQNDKKR